MKNLKRFSEFDKDQEIMESYYHADYFGSIGKERKTKLAQKLDDIRNNLRRESGYSYYGDSKDKDTGVLGSPGKLMKKLVSASIGVAAEVAELFPTKRRKSPKKGEVTTDNDQIELWKEDLGAKTTEKDLVDFAKRSEDMALKRYGKRWDYKNPKGEDQKKYADLIRKGEEEIINRM